MADLHPYEHLSCQEIVELVTDYLEDALPAHERERFDVHLAECDGCSHYVEQMRSTIELTYATAGLEVWPEFAGLLDAFRAAHRAG